MPGLSRYRMISFMMGPMRKQSSVQLLMRPIGRWIRILLRPSGKYAFVASLREGSRLLDVGCGNNSPYRTKEIRPDVFYVGMDIGDYNQKLNVREYADKYIVTSSANFAAELEGLQETFDAVISAHNLEHCEEPQRVLTAMLRSLKKGGEIYLSFPCEASVHFPQRKNTLNFYDDETHLVRPGSKSHFSHNRRGRSYSKAVEEEI